MMGKFWFIVIFAVLFLVCPVTAAYSLSNSSYSPDTLLTPNNSETVSATFYLLPSGTVTFVKSHSLQLSTGLADADWEIQVVLDGRNAAYQTGSGNATFVNGILLSYPTSHDVSLGVTVNGTVPAGSTGSITVLQVEELDNSNSVVPGSVITLNRSVVSSPMLMSTPESAEPALPVSTVPLSPVVTQTPGFGFCLVFLAIAAVFLLKKDA